MTWQRSSHSCLPPPGQAVHCTPVPLALLPRRPRATPDGELLGGIQLISQVLLQRLDHAVLQQLCRVLGPPLDQQLRAPGKQGRVIKGERVGRRQDGAEGHFGAKTSLMPRHALAGGQLTWRVDEGAASTALQTRGMRVLATRESPSSWLCIAASSTCSMEELARGQQTCGSK